MTQRENPAAGTAGHGVSSFRSRIDNPTHKSPKSISQAQFAALSRLRRQRLVERLHRLGPAPLGHFLREIEAGASIPDHLERYAQIDSAFVHALGGDRYAPVLHAIEDAS
jgi:hypothetical protein